MTSNTKELELKESGLLLLKWMEDARKGEEDILFVIGAGLSMSGYNTAPSGWHVAEKYERFLRSQGEDIPESITGNIAKLYEFFCYPEVNGKKEFSMKQHNNFIKNITTNSGSYRFIGEPNFQHRTLINEVQESDGNIRLYSLNLDEYFDIAESISDYEKVEEVINVYDLLDKSPKDNIFRNWRILAAHGKNNVGTRSVWSDGLLTSPLLEKDDSPEYLKEERRLLEKALDCIKEGPNFSKVIFVGLKAPLTYLITTLKSKVKEDFEWAWINPYDSPEEWVYKDSGNLFSNENGHWFKNSLDNILWESQANFYERWLSISCSMNQSNIPLLKKYRTHNLETMFVESIYRARRIYKEGLNRLSTAEWNTESIKTLNKNNHTYRYPELEDDFKYIDSNLGLALHKFYIEKIELMQHPNEYFPNLSIAGKQSEVNPISAHVFKFDPTAPENKIADGIARSFDGVIIRPTHRHIIVIDIQYYHIENLVKAIENAVEHRFPNDYKYIDIIKFEQLDEFLVNNDFTKSPVRARRP